jgi:hypothetical protein
MKEEPSRAPGTPGKFRTEHRGLRASWDQHEGAHLDAYLVSDLEDPRIHPQSILTRAFLVDLLWPKQFNALIEAELRFGLVQSWLLEQMKAGRDRPALLNGVAEATIKDCPPLVSETYHWLQDSQCPVPDYITASLVSTNWGAPEKLLFEPALDTFCMLWRAELEGRPSTPVTVLEPACGSANDFRFLHGFGLAEHIRYAGFDLVEKNVRNAITRFPNGSFFVGSLLEPALGDQAAEFVVVHDLFEHLSAEALECALTELMRITQKEAWLHFFNAADLGEHRMEAVDQYHWNRLSISQLVSSLEREGARVEVIRIAPWLRDKFGYEAFHNPEAVTIIASKE